jgi:hypothetical protein
MLKKKKKAKDYNKRMRVKENATTKKKKTNLIIQDAAVREIMDETGEVLNDTIIQISFEGILINLSVAAAIKLNVQLSKILR